MQNVHLFSFSFVFITLKMYYGCCWYNKQIMTPQQINNCKKNFLLHHSFCVNTVAMCFADLTDRHSLKSKTKTHIIFFTKTATLLPHCLSCKCVIGIRIVQQSHIATWPTPSSIILMVRYSLQQSRQNWCSHIKPVSDYTYTQRHRVKANIRLTVLSYVIRQNKMPLKQNCLQQLSESAVWWELAARSLLHLPILLFNNNNVQ